MFFLSVWLWVAFVNQTGILEGVDDELIAEISNFAILEIALRNINDRNWKF